MFVEWSRSADADLIEILAYFVSIDDMETGQRIVDRLFTATERLESFPLSGKAGRVLETRELILAELPYVLIYRIKGAVVQIVNVIHTSRQYPLQV
ncbi:MAG: type II toxin-antitoxin system RelE/ParE family toxin [Deltaproteobacteria bacterium]|jgi:addiction module RelE/StbE family toxin|nr:type II toxin-antitoxin system RelE/ParE family toxin [Deltaproteobacteria bacterium]